MCLLHISTTCSLHITHIGEKKKDKRGVPQSPLNAKRDGYTAWEVKITWIELKNGRKHKNKVSDFFDTPELEPLSGFERSDD